MKRIDVLLFEKGFYPSREKAKSAVESGRVKLGGKVCLKASTLAGEDVEIEALPFEFVSRGGYKLQKALEEFEISLAGRVVLDIGASTGGFTDVCLKNGAKKVYAVDTGEGQLAEVLREDPRVVDLPKTNYLSLPKASFEDVSFVCIDVSFVSLTKLAGKLWSDFGEAKNFDLVALIKPQFECGPEYARKHKGLVKDEKVREKAVQNVISTFENCGFKKRALVQSPIKGGDGNIEFLVWFGV